MNIKEAADKFHPATRVSSTHIRDIVTETAHQLIGMVTNISDQITTKTSASDSGAKKTITFCVGKTKQYITDIEIAYVTSVQNLKEIRHPFSSFRVRTGTIVRWDGRVEVFSDSDDFHMFVQDTRWMLADPERLIYLEEFLSGKLLHLRKKK